MTQDQKIIRAKVGLLELAKQLGNVSQACKMMGYSRDRVIDSTTNFVEHPRSIGSTIPTSSHRPVSPMFRLAGLTSFKAVVLEGFEVVFIVIAVSAAGGVLIPATTGALAACLLVAVMGLAVHRPLALIPENKLKFAVGVMLSAFGMFWTGEGLGIALLFLSFGLAEAVLLRRTRTEEALP